MQKETITKYLGMTAIVLQDKVVSEEFIDIYYEFLNDIDEDIFILSIKECIKTSRFFPSIADIRERAESFIKQKNIKILTLPDDYDDRAREQDEIRRNKNTEAKGE